VLDWSRAMFICHTHAWGPAYRRYARGACAYLCCLPDPVPVLAETAGGLLYRSERPTLMGACRRSSPLPTAARPTLRLTMHREVLTSSVHENATSGRLGTVHTPAERNFFEERHGVMHLAFRRGVTAPSFVLCYHLTRSPVRFAKPVLSVPLPQLEWVRARRHFLQRPP